MSNEEQSFRFNVLAKEDFGAVTFATLLASAHEVQHHAQYLIFTTNE